MANALMNRARTLPAFVKTWWNGAGRLVPTSEGLLVSSWPWNYWQCGLGPVPNQPNPTVAACVSAYAQTLASLPVYHWRDLPNGGRERVMNSAATRVMRRPNSYQTRAEFFVGLLSCELYEGNGVAVGLRNDRYEISSLHIASPRASKPFIDPVTRDVFYGIGDTGLIPQAYDDIGGWDYVVPAEDVLHLRMYADPDRPLEGLSPIRAAVSSVSAGNAINHHHAAFFSNFSRPSGVLQSDIQLTPKQMQELRQAWDETTTGENSGRVPILGWGLKWTPTSFNSQDSQIIEVQKMTIADIARVYRVPLPIVNVMEGITVANAEQLISNWRSTGLGFVVEHVEQALDWLFRLPSDEYLEFDLDYLMRPDFLARVDGLTKAIQGGLMSPNEARARINLPRAKGGESPRVQAQVVPLENALATPTPAAPSTPAAPAAPAASDAPAAAE